LGPDLCGCGALQVAVFLYPHECAAACSPLHSWQSRMSQRFDSALRLNLHIHTLAIDGVYAADDDSRPQFQVLPAPDDEEIAHLTELLTQRIGNFLHRRGLGPDSDPEESDPLARDQPWLAGLYAASVSGTVTNGGNSGRRITCAGDQIDPEN